MGIFDIFKKKEPTYDVTDIQIVDLDKNFIFQQGKKRRQCRALTRLFNAVEWENSKQKNATLLLNHS